MWRRTVMMIVLGLGAVVAVSCSVAPQAAEHDAPPPQDGMTVDEAIGDAPPAAQRVEREDLEVLARRPLGVIGAVELAVLLPQRVIMQARIDTGATTSSLDARNVQRFERDGQRWVRFEVVDRENEKTHTIETPQTRVVRIKQYSGAFEERSVAKLSISLGGVVFNREFSLADRSGYDFPLLIGRNLLDGQAIVDVAQSNTLKVVLGDD